MVSAPLCRRRLSPCRCLAFNIRRRLCSKGAGSSRDHGVFTKHFRLGPRCRPGSAGRGQGGGFLPKIRPPARPSAGRRDKSFRGGGDGCAAAVPHPAVVFPATLAAGERVDLPLPPAGSMETHRHGPPKRRKSVPLLADRRLKGRSWATPCFAPCPAPASPRDARFQNHAGTVGRGRARRRRASLSGKTFARKRSGRPRFSCSPIRHPETADMDRPVKRSSGFSIPALCLTPFQAPSAGNIGFSTVSPSRLAASQSRASAQTNVRGPATPRRATRHPAS